MTDNLQFPDLFVITEFQLTTHKHLCYKTETESFSSLSRDDFEYTDCLPT